MAAASASAVPRSALALLEALLLELSAEGRRLTVVAYGLEPPEGLLSSDALEEWVSLGCAREADSPQPQRATEPAALARSAWPSPCKLPSQCEALRKALLRAGRSHIAFVLEGRADTAGAAPVGLVHLLRWAQLFLSLPACARLLYLAPCLAPADKRLAKSALRLGACQIVGSSLPTKPPLTRAVAIAEFIVAALRQSAIAASAPGHLISRLSAFEVQSDGSVVASQGPSDDPALITGPHFPPVLLSQIDQLAEIKAVVDARVLGRSPPWALCLPDTGNTASACGRLPPFAPVTLGRGRHAVLLPSSSKRYVDGGYAAEHYVCEEPSLHAAAFELVLVPEALMEGLGDDVAELHPHVEEMTAKWMQWVEQRGGASKSISSAEAHEHDTGNSNKLSPVPASVSDGRLPPPFTPIGYISLLAYAVDMKHDAAKLPAAVPWRSLHAAQVERLVVKQGQRGQGAKEALLSVCTAFHELGYAVRIKTGSPAVDASLRRCPLLAFESHREPGATTCGVRRPPKVYARLLPAVGPGKSDIQKSLRATAEIQPGNGDATLVRTSPEDVQSPPSDVAGIDDAHAAQAPLINCVGLGAGAAEASESQVLWQLSTSAPATMNECRAVPPSARRSTAREIRALLNKLTFDTFGKILPKIACAVREAMLDAGSDALGLGRLHGCDEPSPSRPLGTFGAQSGCEGAPPHAEASCGGTEDPGWAALHCALCLILSRAISERRFVKLYADAALRLCGLLHLPATQELHLSQDSEALPRDDFRPSREAFQRAFLRAAQAIILPTHDSASAAAMPGRPVPTGVAMLASDAVSEAAVGRALGEMWERGLLPRCPGDGDNEHGCGNRSGPFDLLSECSATPITDEPSTLWGLLPRTHVARACGFLLIAGDRLPSRAPKLNCELWRRVEGAMQGPVPDNRDQAGQSGCTGPAGSAFTPADKCVLPVASGIVRAMCAELLSMKSSMHRNGSTQVGPGASICGDAGCGEGKPTSSYAISTSRLAQSRTYCIAAGSLAAEDTATTIEESRRRAAAALGVVLVPEDAPPQKMRGLREGWVFWYVGCPVRNPDTREHFIFDRDARRFHLVRCAEQ